jgi:tRNA (guanine10-N2)-dimethyltransferase
MALMFELSGEHPELPAAEVLGALEAEGAVVSGTRQGPGVLVVEGKGIGPELAPVLASRLALTRRIDRFEFSCRPDEVVDKGKDIQISAESFCVRAKGVHGLASGRHSKAIERGLGEVLAKGSRVDLEAPDHVVHVVLSDLAYVGSAMVEVDTAGFEDRKVQNRPFFSPISLHPKLARAMVNLARSPRGGTILDPFCGTGGILMEAGLMGMKVVGGDLEEKMIDGTRENLEHVAVRDPLLLHGDIGDLPDRLGQDVTVDAVATDAPYGRSTRTFGEELDDIYMRTFEAMGKVLAKGRYMSVTLPVEDMKGFDEIRGMGFEPLGHYPYRVHRSLTRNFMVFRRA